jgi:hypothetical protein
MSYDFLLLPREPEQSRDQRLEANERLALDEDDSPLSPRHEPGWNGSPTVSRHMTRS